MRPDEDDMMPVADEDVMPDCPPEKTDTEKAIEAVRYAPAVPVAAPTGVAFRVTLVPTVTDVNKLPDAFVVKTPNLRGIIATFCGPWREGSVMPECPGVMFTVKREAVSTGRRTF